MKLVSGFFLVFGAYTWAIAGGMIDWQRGAALGLGGLGLVWIVVQCELAWRDR